MIRELGMMNTRIKALKRRRGQTPPCWNGVRLIFLWQRSGLASVFLSQALIQWEPWRLSKP